MECISTSHSWCLLRNEEQHPSMPSDSGQIGELPQLAVRMRLPWCANYRTPATVQTFIAAV